MSRIDDVFRPALEGKSIPVLTLDNKWHRLFTQDKVYPQIKKGEEELNSLLKRQGKLTNDVKEVRKLKKLLVDEIVGLKEESEQGSKGAQKKLEDHTRLITECNEKLAAYQDELLDIPALINKVNYELMLSTMEICYEQIRSNTAEIAEIAEWIAGIRRELKIKIIRKQEKELSNNNLYQYMHQVFGGEVIEIFDMQYNPGGKKEEEGEKEKEKETKALEMEKKEDSGEEQNP